MADLVVNGASVAFGQDWTQRDLKMATTAQHRAIASQGGVACLRHLGSNNIAFTVARENGDVDVYTISPTAHEMAYVVTVSPDGQKTRTPAF